MKTIKPHSDSNFVKGFQRYVLMQEILDSNSWLEMESKLKKYYGDGYQKIISRLFNEFKFYNCVLSVEYHITDRLNSFLIEEDKINDWDKLKERFLEKIERNMNTKRDKAEEVLKKEVGGKIERILTPSMMFDFAGFGIGELINFINEFTISFFKKEELIAKLTEFNESRKIVIHRIITSRENVEEKIEKGILLSREIVDLIDKITNNESKKILAI